MRSSGVLFILMFIAFQLYGMKYDVEDNDNREDSKSVVLNAMSSPIGHLIKINILWELCGNVNNVNIKEFFGDDDTVTIYPSNTYWSHVSELFNNPFDIITNIPCKSRPRQITYETNHYKTELSDNRIKHEVSFVRELFFPFGADFILQSNDKAYTYSFLECSIIGFFITYRCDLYRGQLNNVKQLSYKNGKYFEEVCKTLLNNNPKAPDRKMKHTALKYFPKQYITPQKKGCSIANYFDNNGLDPVQSEMKEYSFNIKVISQ